MCFLGSGRTELGGGEEHAGRPNEPGRWLRGNEGKVAHLILPYFHLVSAFSHILFDLF